MRLVYVWKKAVPHSKAQLIVFIVYLSKYFHYARIGSGVDADKQHTGDWHPFAVRGWAGWVADFNIIGNGNGETKTKQKKNRKKKNCFRRNWTWLNRTRATQDVTLQTQRLKNIVSRFQPHECLLNSIALKTKFPIKFHFESRVAIIKFEYYSPAGVGY